MRSLCFVLASSCAVALAAGCSSDETSSESGSNPARGTDGGSNTEDKSIAGGPGLEDGGRVEGGPPADDAGPTPMARPYVDYDLNHIVVTGQSNAVANSGTPVLSNAQPYDNRMFDVGVMPGSGCDGAGCRGYQTPTSLVPLVEGDNFFNYAVETISSGLANEATQLAGLAARSGDRAAPRSNHAVLVSVHGRSGNTYWCLRKGGCSYKTGYLGPFDESIRSVTDAKALADRARSSYVVRAVATIHGESDHYSYTAGVAEFPLDGSDGTPKSITSYADALLEWQRDYETSIRAVTGQTEPVPLFVSQISGWNDTSYSRVAQFQLDAHVASDHKVVLIGPSYQLPTDQRDCKHFTNDGERRLGEYFAKVYARVVFEGRAWEPLRPRSVERDGATVRVRFFVPVPPLVIDTERVAAADNDGFAWVDDANVPQPITSVALTGADTVTVTLAQAPAAGGRLRYAQNQVPSTCIATPRGARGNLRDSDATPSLHGYDLHNWAVHFDVAVP